MINSICHCHLEEIIIIYLIHQIHIQGSFSLLNKNTRIRGSIGTSYLAPNGFQMSKTDYLEAETGSSYEIGIDHTFENLDLDFDITFFNNSYKQSIEYVPNTDSYTNYSNAKIKGFEIGSNISIRYFKFTYFLYLP